MMAKPIDGRKPGPLGYVIMEIVVNGQALAVPPGYTARQLVEKLGLTGRRVAMEVNRDILPRSAYDAHVLQQGDRIEIVQAVGGG